MQKTKLLVALIASFSASAAFAGGTVAPAPVEAPAAEAPAPAPAPVAVAPAPAPVVVAPVFVPSWYVGASVARSHITTDIGDADATGGKIFGGYRFHPNMAVELSYVNTGSDNGVRGEGGSLDLLGILPVSSNFDVFGKVGVASMKLKTDIGDSGSKTGANYGIGATYHFNRNIGIRAEAERFEKVGDVADAKANLYSVGIQYSF